MSHIKTPSKKRRPKRIGLKKENTLLRRLILHLLTAPPPPRFEDVDRDYAYGM